MSVTGWLLAPYRGNYMWKGRSRDVPVVATFRTPNLLNKTFPHTWGTQGGGTSESSMCVQRRQGCKARELRPGAGEVLPGSEGFCHRPLNLLDLESRPGCPVPPRPFLTMANMAQAPLLGRFGPTDATEGQRVQCKVHQGVVAAEATAACLLQDLVHLLGRKQCRRTWVSHPVPAPPAPILPPQPGLLLEHEPTKEHRAGVALASRRTLSLEEKAYTTSGRSRLLMKSMALSMVATMTMGKMGPKTSSCMIGSEGCTSASTVGAAEEETQRHQPWAEVGEDTLVPSPRPISPFRQDTLPSPPIPKQTFPKCHFPLEPALQL